jgi:hypothetical protein
MKASYPCLAVEQRLVVVLSHHLSEQPYRTTHYALKSANKWVERGRKFEDLPLLRQVRST